MEIKTKVDAKDGEQFILITREFELPVELLFKAYTEAEFLTQWMGTKVIKLESRKHGSYEFETHDPQGNLAFIAAGVFHDLIPDEKMVRTFEMESKPFGVQLEFYTFEPVGEDKSLLSIRSVYETVAQRDQVLKLPFAQGINMAHNRLQSIFINLK